MKIGGPKKVLSRRVRFQAFSGFEFRFRISRFPDFGFSILRFQLTEFYNVKL